MSLPETVQVKISSEVAESIGLSPVVVQDMALEELIGLLLGVTRKDAGRIREILLRGSVVSGASRFRWRGFDVSADDVTAYLTRYPDSDASLRFVPSHCFQVVLRGTTAKPLVLEREAGEKRRLLRSRSFWDELMALADRPEYVEYSYRERADIFRMRLGNEGQAKLRDAAKWLAYSSLEKQIREGSFNILELCARR